MIKPRARLIVLIILALGIITAMLLYSSPRKVLSYNENQWQGEDLKALKILEKQIGLTMGEVCDPLPCWLVIEVEGIEVLQQHKPRQKLGDYVHTVKTTDIEKFDDETFPIGSRMEGIDIGSMGSIHAFVYFLVLFS